MKIEAKPKYSFTIVLVPFGLSLLCYVIYVFSPRLIFPLLGSLLTMSGILLGVQFHRYNKVLYETRNDGIYLMKNNNVLRFISYKNIKAIDRTGETIRIIPHGIFGLDEILRPLTDADKMVKEIEQKIAEQNAQPDAQ